MLSRLKKYIAKFHSRVLYLNVAFRANSIGIIDIRLDGKVN